LRLPSGFGGKTYDSCAVLRVTDWRRVIPTVATANSGGRPGRDRRPRALNWRQFREAKKPAWLDRSGERQRHNFLLALPGGHHYSRFRSHEAQPCGGLTAAALCRCRSQLLRGMCRRSEGAAFPSHIGQGPRIARLRGRTMPSQALEDFKSPTTRQMREPNEDLIRTVSLYGIQRCGLCEGPIAPQ
jgi:hypothetical protein